LVIERMEACRRRATQQFYRYFIISTTLILGITSFLSLGLSDTAALIVLLTLAIINLPLIYHFHKNIPDAIFQVVEM